MSTGQESMGNSAALEVRSWSVTLREALRLGLDLRQMAQHFTHSVGRYLHPVAPATYIYAKRIIREVPV